MKITMTDFNYKGCHIGQVEFNLLNVHEIDGVFKELIVDYVVEVLDEFIEQEMGES